MAISLVELVKGVLDTEGDNLTNAKKDLKTLKNNARGVKLSREILAEKLRALKAERIKADVNGGGAKSAALVRDIAFLRQVLNEMTEEHAMIKLHKTQCALYIKHQADKVKSIDAHWENLKAAEAQTAE